MDGKRTLVIGATTHPWRYAFLAINKLSQKGHIVVALGKEKGEVSGVMIETERKNFEKIDTVTLYINPEIQKGYYDYILNTIHPKRIIFNPGTENPDLKKRAEEKGIQTIEACTLVMLSTGQY